MITATGGSTPAGIKSYSSSNTNVATIDDNTSVQVNCYNCRIVRVVCKKAGSVILSATSTTGATTTSSLTVNKDVGTISFAQSSYTCKAGESFQTLITAIGPEGQIATVSTFKSSNTNIATIDTNVTMVPNCYNCRMVRVNCLKSGTVSLSATSSTGAKTVSNLTVANK